MQDGVARLATLVEVTALDKLSAWAEWEPQAADKREPAASVPRGATKDAGAPTLVPQNAPSVRTLRGERAQESAKLQKLRAQLGLHTRCADNMSLGAITSELKRLENAKSACLFAREQRAHKLAARQVRRPHKARVRANMRASWAPAGPAATHGQRRPPGPAISSRTFSRSSRPTATASTSASSRAPTTPSHASTAGVGLGAACPSALRPPPTPAAVVLPVRPLGALPVAAVPALPLPAPQRGWLAWLLGGFSPLCCGSQGSVVEPQPALQPLSPSIAAAVGIARQPAVIPTVPSPTSSPAAQREQLAAQCVSSTTPDTVSTAEAGAASCPTPQCRQTPSPICE